MPRAILLSCDPDYHSLHNILNNGVGIVQNRYLNRWQVVRLTIDEFCTELNYDFLYIFDGCNITSPLIAQITGCRLSSKSYLSSHSCMSVRFTSGAAVVISGFTAHYSSESGSVMWYLINSHCQMLVLYLAQQMEASVDFTSRCWSSLVSNCLRCIITETTALWLGRSTQLITNTKPPLLTLLH